MPEDESYLNKRGLTHFWENIDDIKQDKLTAGAGISITGNTISATGGGTADAVDWGHITGSMSNQTDLTTALAAKANTADLATVATSGDYDDLTDKPTIGNATLTIQKNGTSAGTFTANATSNQTINITVPTTAADVSALPASTKYGASISVSINTTDYKVTTTLKDQDGNTLGTAQVVDLPLESVVVNGSYDSTNKKIVLTLQNGNTIDIPVADLVSGLQSEITSSNKLASDLVDDTNQTHKFTTAADITKLAGIATGAEVNVQSDWDQTTNTADDYIKNKPNLAAVATSGAYSDLSGTPSLATVATSGSYNDLSNKPTIPAAQVNSDWNSASGVSEILNKPTLSTVATTGDYGDLTGTPNLATVATSGSYNDLTNKPTIPTVNNATLTIQKNGTNVQTFTANQSTNATANITVPTKTSDLSNDSGFLTSIPTASASTLGGIKVGSGLTIANGVLSTNATAPSWDDITNKPTFATVATSGSYTDLTDKPTIPTVNSGTLTIQKNSSNVATFGANQSTDVTANITVPTYYQFGAQNGNTAITTGIVFDKLLKLIAGDNITLGWDSTSQSFHLTINADVPTKTSDLTNDSGFLTSVAWGDVTGKPTFATVATSGSYNDLSNKPTIPAAQVQSDWTQATTTAVDYIKNKPTLATVATSGSYSDLSNKPTIPTDTSDLTNGAGFITGIAAGSVTGNANSDTTVGTSKIALATIGTPNLRDSAVSSAKIAAGAITGNANSDTAVGTSKIALATIGTPNLRDSAVSTAKIAGTAVTTAKIADLNVTTGKLANGAVTGVANTATSIGTAKLALATVGTPNLRDDAVTYAKMNYTTYGRFAGNLSGSSYSQSYTAGTSAVAKVPNQVMTAVGATYSTSTGAYTISQPGIWLITGGGRGATDAAQHGSVRIWVNGSNVAVGSGTGYASSSVKTTFNTTLSWIGHLAANDTVQLAITCSAALTNSNSATQQHLEGVCLFPD